MKTAERVSHVDASDNFVLARSVLAYREAARRVAGHVLEIGTGSGYGVELLAPAAVSLTSVDKSVPVDLRLPDNAEFRQMRVPPFDLPDGRFDCVVSFQVIEHIRDDFAFLDEVCRVLKPGGRLILTTPNAPMSITRNPWHVREYSAGQFTSLLESRFGRVEAMGVVGDELVMEYYRQNRKSVERITRFDPLRLRDRLPAWCLRIPYDIANRLNRKRLLAQNDTLTRGIAPENYRLAPVSDNAFDLFYVATKC